MKTLKQIREEYNNNFFNQVEIPEMISLDEASVKQSKVTRSIPSYKTMPALLLFRRVTYKMYPDKQVVALYYSKMVDKYLSIPFGPGGNLNLSESKIYNTLEEAEDDDPYGVKAAIDLVPGAKAYQKWKEGDKAGALKSGAIDAALVGAGGGALKALSKATAGKGIIGGAKEIGKRLLKAPGKVAGKAVDVATKAAAVKSLTGGDSSPASLTTSQTTKKSKPVSGPKTYSSFEKSPGSVDPITRKRQQIAALKENKMSDIRKMVSEGIESKDININGRTVTLNTSMAKRILEVYDSVNTKNKKIVEGMLNEDLESFKKLLNFSIRK